MRFQRKLNLQKQQAAQLTKREKTESLLFPYKDLVNAEYLSVRKWNDPMTSSMERVQRWMSQLPIPLPVPKSSSKPSTQIYSDLRPHSNSTITPEKLESPPSTSLKTSPSINSLNFGMGNKLPNSDSKINSTGRTGLDSILP